MVVAAMAASRTPARPPESPRPKSAPPKSAQAKSAPSTRSDVERVRAPRRGPARSKAPDDAPGAGLAGRRVLGKEAWVAEALRSLATGGLAAVSVERLAVALGVTKGSFYWHFANRAALIVAVLECWERVATEDVIAALDAVADPRERLTRLLALSLDQLDHLRAEAALQAAAGAGDSVVAPVVARVVRRRLSYTESLFRAIGLSRSEAATRARVALGAYLGSVLLAAQGLVGSGRELVAQRRLLERLLVV